MPDHFSLIPGLPIPIPLSASATPTANLTLSGFLAAGVVAVVLGFSAYWVSLQHNRAADWVRHSHEVLASMARTRAAVVDIQNGHRGYTISGDERELQPYHDGVSALLREMDHLARLVAHSPAQLEQLVGLRALLAARLESAADLVTARRVGGFAAARSIVDSGKPTAQMVSLRAVLQRLEDEEGRLLAGRLQRHEENLRLFWVGITGTVLVLLSALAALYLEVRRRRLAQQKLLETDEELQRMNRTLESQVEQRTHELSGARQRLRELSERLITAQEQERRHLARELHDQTGQSLTAIRLHVMDVVRGSPGAVARLNDCLGVVDGTIAQIRGMALNLRPTMLDDLGLVDALEWVLGQQARAAGWVTSFEPEEPDCELGPDVQTACFRIAQEALTNAARHARASHVQLALRQADGWLELTLADDGEGFDLAHSQTPGERRKHFGLVSMSERASLLGGRLDIHTAPGAGTRIVARFPLEVRAEAPVPAFA
jgi:signal transduction histidine kinase